MNVPVTISCLIVGLITGTAAGLAQARSVYMDAGKHHIAIGGHIHPFRGPEAFMLFPQDSNDDLYLSVGYILKSWIVGPLQNFYLSTGAQLIASDTSSDLIRAVSWRNRFHYEPRAWQKTQLAGEINFAPHATTFDTGQRIGLGALQVEYFAFKQTAVEIGWRQLRVSLENGQRIDISQGGFMGLRHEF